MATARVAPEKQDFSTCPPFALPVGDGLERSMVFVPYKEQIKHPLWQKKRLEILNEKGFQCQMCGAEDKQLHVHHKFYKKGAMIWDYESEDLLVLCSDCHASIHAKKELLKKLIDTIDIYQFENLYSLIDGFLSDYDKPEGFSGYSYSATAIEAGNLANLCEMFSVESIRGLYMLCINDPSYVEKLGLKAFEIYYSNKKDDD